MANYVIIVDSMPDPEDEIIYVQREPYPQTISDLEAGDYEVFNTVTSENVEVE